MNQNKLLKLIDDAIFYTLNYTSLIALLNFLNLTNELACL